MHQHNQFLTESFIKLDVFHHLHSYEDIIFIIILPSTNRKICGKEIINSIKDNSIN
jgi:hypothetical protein